MFNTKYVIYLLPSNYESKFKFTYIIICRPVFKVCLYFHSFLFCLKERIVYALKITLHIYVVF